MPAFGAYREQPMIADLRGYGSPIQFGSETDRQAYLAEVKAVRATQSFRFAVAPRCAVTTPWGKVITAGCEVRASDLHGQPNAPAWRLLRDLVHSGRVLEADSAGDDALETTCK